MNKWNLTLLLLSINFILTSYTIPDSSDISVQPSSNLIKQFEILTVKINLTQPFENPFDPEDIRVDAIINTPNGEFLTLPCFYKAGASKKSEWEARFTAMQPGAYTCYIQSISHRDTLYSRSFPLDVKASGNDGFLRLNANSMYSFLFDSGKLFRGVGLNLGWEMQSEWRYPYETYFEVLKRNSANFTRIWMCTWNLPLEWTRINNYDTFTDEFENWEKTFSHTAGLKLNSGRTKFTEEDSNRVTIASNSTEAVIYHIKDIRRFKIKLFYKKNLSTDRIKCYSSIDNISYHPIDIEFSQTWDTKDDWHRQFIAYIYELPEGTNYLKIEFLDHLEGTPHIANIMIEHGAPRDVLDAPGLGRYYEKTANRLDKIFRLAEQQGIYIMLTIDYHGVFKSFIDRWASNAEWRTNPYNAANGGPCKTPTDFFTNTEARKIYKNKLRYLIARWGYSTHLAVWEFWNEIDNVMETQQVPADAIASWHQEMSDYLKQLDLYKHLVSTSVTNREIEGLWDIKNIDFTQHHNYGPTANMKTSILKYVDRFHKPDVVGEFALGWKGPGKDYPEGLYEGELHNGIWRGMFSPTPILPLSWWWEYHFHQQHYFHLKTAADFVSLILKNNKDVQEITVKSHNSDIETMGLQSEDQLFIWLRNSTIKLLNDLTLTIPGTGNSKYLMKYYDTWTGKFSDDIRIKSENDQLVLQAIRLQGDHDMAVWLKPLEK
jgi:hypothetical protein